MTLVADIGVSGGGERFARDVTLGIDADRFERTLCVTRWSDERARRPAAQRALAGLEAADVRFLGLPRTSRHQLGAWRPLVDLLRGERIDILHSHMFGSNVTGALLARLCRVPIFVAHEQTWSYQGRPMRKMLDRELIARGADAFIAVSSEDRRRMIEVERIDPEKIVMIPNAVVAPPQATGGAGKREELGIPADAPLVGMVCVLRPQKAVEVLLEAALLLREQLPDLRVLIAGDGPERASLETAIERMGLSETVRILGIRDDVGDLVDAFDVATLCSDFEGTPLAVMEYMEAAKPIAVTRVGGLPDMIRDGIEGLLVDPRDPPALARAIAELLADRGRGAEMGERARARRRSEFDIPVAARRLEQLYAELAARRR